MKCKLVLVIIENFMEVSKNTKNWIMLLSKNPTTKSVMEVIRVSPCLLWHYL